MFRHFVCGLVALALVVGAGLAADKGAKKGKAATGKFESFADGTLKIKVGKKDNAKVQEFKLPDDLKVVTFQNDEKKELNTKDAFKELKADATVSVTLGEGDKVTGVTVGTGPKKTTGSFASFKDGTLTLKVKNKKGDEAKEFKVADDTKAVTLVGNDKKEGKAKEALQTVAEGTPVTLTLGEKNKVTGIQVGNVKKK